MGPYRYQIIKYSGLSCGTYTDLVLSRNFLLLLLYLNWTTNQRSIPLEYLLQLLVQCHHGPLSVWILFSFCQGCWKIGGCGSRVFIGAEVDGEGGKGSGDTKEVDVETILETVVHTYLHTYNQTNMHKLRCMHTFHGSIRV